ncbi:MAG: hypothetical protein ACT4PV_15955 [Planctomycetaceae bacterium]
MRTLGIGAIAGTALLALLFTLPLDPATAEVPTGTPTFSDPLAIDNAHLPFLRYRIRLYEQVKGGGDLHVIDVYLGGTRMFEWNGAMVECAMLQEWEVDAGEVVEISINYFAQADDGTVYYFGETVDKYDGGAIVGHGGSWLVGGPEAGDPAETVTADDPTIFMPADPEVGDQWKAEDLPDFDIEEFDEVVKIVKKLKVPAGKFKSVLKVKEETPDVGFKWYAPGVGFIQQQDGREVVSLEEIIDNDDADEMAEELEEILEELLGCDEDDDDDDDCGEED